MNLLEAMVDPALFGPWFGGPSWDPWKAFLRGLFGLPMSSQDLSLFEKCPGRSTSPIAPAREGWVICGRRAGKSHIMSLIAVYLACFKDRTASLSPGEVPTIMLLAADRRQARTLHRYVRGLLENVPLLASMIQQTTTDSVILTNNVVIEIHAASFRSVRGYSLIACICDELSFWRSDESANPDTEIVNALRPGLMTVRGSLLLAISSPYSQRGILWETFKKHWGKEGSTLVWRASTQVMNTMGDPDLIAQAYESDPVRVAAEFGASFRSDLEGLVDRAVVEDAVIQGRHELLWIPHIAYRAFCDPSGGSSDSFTIAVALGEDDRVILDCVRERRPPFSPDAVCEEFSAVLKSYKLFEVQGDKYAGLWPRERFQAHGIYYRPAEKTKSDMYIELLPLLNAGRAELLDHPKLVAQLAGLERRTNRAGRDSVDHPPHSHDDIINSAAGASLAAQGRVEIVDSMFGWGDPTDFSVASLTDDSDRGFIHHGF